MEANEGSNPYAVIEPVTVPPPVRTWWDHFCTYVALAIVIWLACYGAIRLGEDIGLVVFRNGEAQFWFEGDLRRWIHKR